MFFEPSHISNRSNNPSKNKWVLSRRSFVKFTLATGILSQIPLATSCINQDDLGMVIISIGNEKYSIELKIIRDVQDILFPKDELGPGALELKSDLYLVWVLNDKYLDPADSKYIINGFKKLNKTSKDGYGKRFTKLKSNQQEDLVARISMMDWGQRWLSKMLILIFESMYANPNYRSNPEGIGWRWLNHQEGWPQPKPEQIYPNILENIKKRYK